MKKLLLILSIFLVGSCTDLEVIPKDSLLEGVVFTSEENYTGYLAKIYASFSLTGQQGPAGDTDLNIISDEGFTSYIRSYWKAQELTTDEAVIAWADAGVQDLHNHVWSSENQFIRVLYYRIMYSVALANDFLRVSSDDALETNGISEDFKPTIRGYQAEARFLRALAYYHAIDLYRNIPLITAVSTELPRQATSQQMFDFLISELNDIESFLPEPRSGDYGRADKAAVWMLRAKLYLNSEVYIGSSMYAECLTEVEKVLAAGYGLSTDYGLNFRADNHLSPELIFTFPADGVQSQSWGTTSFLVHGSIGGSMTDTDYGVVNGWAGMRTTSTFVSKFDDITGATDSRAIFYTDGQTLEIAELTEFTEGYAVPKFTNLDSNGLAGANNTHVDTDYPVFRLADVYLMYAECFLRNGGGDATTALGYVNELRERAYGDMTGNITSSDLTLDFILDERSRELYWEGHRRQDLVRFESFTTAGIWPWKGGVAEGKVTGIHRNIFPIPASDLTANPKLDQNDGY
ncbi:MAG: RagB/SusD family nutrient uptake outer membrane protein [Cyclobacteriaceae bacterium]